jgi:cell division protein FtsB
VPDDLRAGRPDRVHPPFVFADLSTTLVGVGAVLAPIGALVAAMVTRKRRGSAGDQDDELVADATARIQVLKDTITDLQASIERCRNERDLMASDARATVMHIAQLEAQLAACRAELRDTQAKLGGTS